ncbi:MAG: RNA-binding protein S4 [Alphaproteobacteria bacterium]|nr:MAG: RNA-binding protein S4 [Alphaproteobacteria bacterium]
MISNILEKKTLRLDIYLYYIRIFKSRSIATKFVSTNRLRISGQVTQKPHKMISIGDVLTITINDNIKILKVLDIPNRRGPYSESLNFYEDITPIEIIPKKESLNIDIKFVERVGRPTKRERRQTDRLMGRD